MMDFTTSGRDRRRRSIDGFPEFVELMVLTAGTDLTTRESIVAAADTAAPDIAAAAREFEHRLDRGQCVADALTAFVDVLGPDASAFTDSLAAADRYGLAMTPVLDQLALDARRARRRRAERDARTLPVRLAFPLVICTLPSFVLLAIAPAVLGVLSTLRAG